jgi:hypothetical protein
VKVIGFVRLTILGARAAKFAGMRLFQFGIKSCPLLRIQHSPEFLPAASHLLADMSGNRFQHSFDPFLTLPQNLFGPIPLLGGQLEIPLRTAQEFKPAAGLRRTGCTSRCRKKLHAPEHHPV